MTVVEKLVVRLVADATKFTPVFSGASKTINNFSKKLTAFGRRMTMSLTLPLVLFGGVAVNNFAKFDKAMIESTSIMKTTEEQVQRMTEQALNLSKVGPQGPEELAKSYYFLASAGLDAEKAMAALPLVQKFATAGAFDMAKATDLLTDAQSALGLVSKNTTQNMLNMGRLSDVLVKANTLANASVEQFSTSLTSKAGSSLKAFGKDVEEGVAVLAAFADQGIKAELSGNALDRIIRLLSKSALENAEAHQQLGFKVFDSAGNMRNLGDIVGNLETILSGMDDQTKVTTLSMLGFEARVQQVILPLLGTSDAIKNYERELRVAGGTTESVADKQMKAFSNQLQMIKNQIYVASVALARGLAPAVLWVGKKVESLANWFNSLSTQTKTAIGVVVGLTAVIGPLAIAAGTLLSMIGASTMALSAMGVSAGTVTAILAGLPAILGAIAAVGFAAWVYKSNTALQEFNKQLEKTNELSQQLADRTAKQQQNKITQIGMLSGDARKNAIAEELKKAELQIGGLKLGVEQAENEFDKFNTTWGQWTGSKELERSATALDDANKRLKVQRDYVQQLRDLQNANMSNPAGANQDVAKALEDMLNGAGGDGAELVTKKQKQIELEAEHNRLMAEGAMLTKQLATPQEQYAATMDNLNKLHKEGAISWETFIRAERQALETLNRLEDVNAIDPLAGGDSDTGIDAVAANAAQQRQISVNLQSEQQKLLRMQALDPGSSTETKEERLLGSIDQTLENLDERDKKKTKEQTVLLVQGVDS